MHDKNLSYSTLNTAHAALSPPFPKDWDDFGLLPLAVCFMIGLFKNRAPHPRSREIHVWDALTVLNYLTTLYSTRTTVTQTPNIKADNVALTGYGSKRTINPPVEYIDAMNHTDSSLTFQPTSHTKTNKPRCSGSPIVIQELKPDLQLCPLHTLRA